nr:hypothetical protein [Burkholderia sp. 8Y]
MARDVSVLTPAFGAPPRGVHHNLAVCIKYGLVYGHRRLHDPKIGDRFAELLSYAAYDSAIDNMRSATVNHPAAMCMRPSSRTVIAVLKPWSSFPPIGLTAGIRAFLEITAKVCAPF